MKVNYYFRNPDPGNFSIENIFHTVQDELKNDIEKNNFFVENPLDIRAIYKVSKLTADLHHITGAVNYLSLGLPVARTILTVHDVGHYIHTLKGISKYIYGMIYWKIPPIRRNYLTAISEFTKAQLVNLLNLDASRITVIPNPLPSYFQSIPKVFNYDTPTILQIGRGANKNVESLIEAVEGLRCKLLLIRPPDDWLVKLLTQKKIDFQFRSGLDQKGIAQAYADSDLIFFASTYEGFGMPILEGQAVGRPVITSNVAAMPEVLKVKNSGHLVNPYSIEEIRNGILKICKEPAYRDELIGNGYRNICHFEKNKIASEYLSLYHKIINGI